MSDIPSAAPTAPPTAIVVGVGPGLGAAVARRFAAGGYAVGLVARSEASLAPTLASIEEAGGVASIALADAADPAQVAAAHAKLTQSLGPAEVLVYNAGFFRIAGILDIDPELFETAWKVNCQGAFLWSRQVLPAMVEAQKGTVLLTGATASVRGSARFSCLAVGKHGLRALAQSMARELGPKGIHVAHVIVDGMIDTPRIRQMMPDRDPATLLAPDAIAESYWHLHTQHPTTWTLELDLRPSVEKF